MMALLLRASLLTLAVATCLAEDAVIAKSTVMRAERSLVSLKAGTVVEVVERGDKTVSILYKGQAGTIPAASLGAPAAPAPTAAAAKPAGPAAKPQPAAPKSLVADQPKSFYGNVVKKAETNAAKHEDNLVKPADDVMADTPAK